ncbi:endonuclease/exonuclease/phosphatase family protein [Hydromonas duriensis]|uniref:Endonuclease/exonuclease/phosphatase family protein n=1 Tax=Hydromonas duriensis TaxID=1527608 RepID=A0A4R6YA54_9BURK|nr:endonuclease/exonuclease/phosphatase family protein [Hydromonas duriensis]TDR32401.1 endonuclease/exonuclease/phosphatase family protein [Hydromonas duriensis]
MPNVFRHNDAFDIGVKIGTFNLRNFAKAGFQFYANQDPYTQHEYDAKIAWTAAQIDSMNADIIVFQEVFHLDALTEAVRASRTMKHAKIIGRDAVGMPPKNSLVPQVAIATRLPLAEEPNWVSHYSKDFTVTPPGYEMPLSHITRAVLHVAVTLPNEVKLHVLGLHLKSKRPDYLHDEDESNPDDLALATYRSLMRRGADAIGIRQYLNGLLQRNHEPCVVTGDYNDHAHAVSTQIIAGSGRFGKSFYDFQLFDAMRIQTKNDPQRYVAYTHIHEGALEVMDHVFVSEEFHPQSRNQIAQVREVFSLNDHLHSHSPETSDHGQTVAHLLFKRSNT